MLNSKEVSLDTKVDWLRKTIAFQQRMLQQHSSSIAMMARHKAIMVRWMPLAKNTFKININGASKAKNNRSTVASIIRDNTSKQMIGTICSPLISEI